MNLTKGRGWEITGEGPEHKKMREFVFDRLWHGAKLQCHNQVIAWQDCGYTIFTETPLGRDGHLISAFCELAHHECEMNYRTFDGTECPACMHFPYHRSIAGEYCIPDIMIVNPAKEIEYIVEIIQNHEVESAALDIYSKIPYLKAMLRFKADKPPFFFAHPTSKLIVNSVECYNGYKWKGEYSAD